MRGPLLLSIAVHAAALIGARPIAARLAQLAPSSEPAPAAPEPDRLTGTSIEVSTSLEDTPGASQPPAGSPLPVAAAPPSDPASPAPAPAETAPADATAAPSTSPSAAPSIAPSTTPTAPPPPSAGSAPAPSASATSTRTSSAASTTSSPADKPRPPRPPRKKRPRPPASPAPSTSTSAVASAASASPASASPASASPDPASSSASASASPAATGTGAGSGGTFGPDGVASKRDLGRAFTRALPFACAGDALWTKVPTGDAGTLRAVLHIDADGHVTGAEPLGDAPPKHLASLLQRTVAQLKAGIFAVRDGAVTAGTQTLEIKATVSADPGDDALAFEYDSGRGKAAFIVKDGRRVDVHLRVVKVEVGN